MTAKKLTLQTATVEQLAQYQEWLCAESARVCDAMTRAFDRKNDKQWCKHSNQLELIGAAMDELWLLKRARKAAQGGAA